jgi:hypothetical protein
VIEELVAEIFKKIGHTWKIRGGGFVVPDESDVATALDRAATVLYDSDPGTVLEMGGLRIEKNTDNLSVYVYVGDYN